MKDLAERRAARRAQLATETPEESARIEARRQARREAEARLWAQIEEDRRKLQAHIAGLLGEMILPDGRRVREIV